MRLSHLFSLGLVVCLALTLSACGGKDEKDAAKENVAEKASASNSGEAEAEKNTAPSHQPIPPQPTSEEPREPDFRLTAEQFYKEVDNGSDTAKRYQNKIIELTGVVFGFGRDTHFHPSLSLEGGQDCYVDCSTSMDEPWALVSPGQEVAVQGRMLEGFGGILIPALMECDIVPRGPNPAIVISPAELAREVLEDPKASHKKYSEKWLILEGKIANVETGKRGDTIVYLETPNDIKIACTFVSEPKHVLDSLKVNRQVKVAGNRLALVLVETLSNDPDDLFRLSYCQLITEAGSSASGVQD